MIIRIVCRNFKPHALSRLVAKEGRDFILQIKVGDQFSFCIESGMWIPAQKSTNNENRTTRKKSASGIEDDAQNKKLPGVMEEGLIIKEEARET